MLDLATDTLAGAATVSTWPALAAYVLGLLAIGFGQWRQHRVTKDVQHQVTNNGGKTMKDAVDRTERGQEELRTMLAEHIAAEPARRWRTRREAAGLAAMAALVSVAVTLSQTRRW